MVEEMKIMATSFKRALSALDPAAGHHPPTTSAGTPGQLRASLGQSLVGSLLLSPESWCAEGFVCALQEFVSTVLYKFWWFFMGSMATSSKMAYAIPRSVAPRAPVAGHC